MPDIVHDMKLFEAEIVEQDIRLIVDAINREAFEEGLDLFLDYPEPE